MISIKNISLKIPGVEKFILSNLNYEIKKGDFVVILGSNGSGKSSLLKLLDKRYQPTSGEIFLDQKSIADFSEKEFSQTVKTLTQNCDDSLFNSLTVMENYCLFSRGGKINKNYFSDYIKQFNPNLSTKLDQTVEKLSGGEKQALALALCVLHPPKILLLDEHTSALDPNSAKKLMVLTQEVISKNNITCVLTTHDLNIALNYGNRILALRHGQALQLIDEKEKSALDQSQLLAACY